MMGIIMAMLQKEVGQWIRASCSWCTILLKARWCLFRFFFFFFNDPAPTEIYPLPLHDALPIYSATGLTREPRSRSRLAVSENVPGLGAAAPRRRPRARGARAPRAGRARAPAGARGARREVPRQCPARVARRAGGGARARRARSRSAEVRPRTHAVVPRMSVYYGRMPVLIVIVAALLALAALPAEAQLGKIETTPKPS